MIIILSVGTVLTVLAVFFFASYCFLRKSRKEKQWLSVQNQFINEDFHGDSSSNDSTKADLSTLKIILENEFKIVSELGSGAFGKVFKGLLFSNQYSLDIAIKVLNKDVDSQKSQEILNEAHIMASVNHPYCLRLVGICMAEQNMIITPLLPLGSVLDFFEKYKNKVNEKMLLVWAVQIAQGMGYLEQREIVHCDLAARNVLVQSHGHVKITDFGLSKILDYGTKCYKGNYNTKLPLKWLAPECIENRQFTHKSDVWAYGVTCWELFTLGMKPYAEISKRDMQAHIKQGTR